MAVKQDFVGRIDQLDAQELDTEISQYLISKLKQVL
jgi:hypothetical protein